MLECTRSTFGDSVYEDATVCISYWAAFWFWSFQLFFPFHVFKVYSISYLPWIAFNNN